MPLAMGRAAGRLASRGVGAWRLNWYTLGVVQGGVSESMSLPESEDTEEADEPDDRSCGPGRGRVRRGPKGGSGSRRGGWSPSQVPIRSAVFTLLSGSGAAWTLPPHFSLIHVR